jgi:ribosomal protein S18 acetylase RimI-like enzyme
VHPDARGRGRGRLLTLACVERARTQGAATLGIHTTPAMTAACALYERLGFRRAPEHDLRAAQILGLGAGAGDLPVIAYRLDLARA